MHLSSISHKIAIARESTVDTMDSKLYKVVPRKEHLPALNVVLGNMWILHFDNAVVCTAVHTKAWLKANGVHILN